MTKNETEIMQVVDENKTIASEESKTTDIETETTQNTVLQMQVVNEDKTDILDNVEAELTENKLEQSRKPQEIESVFINELISNKTFDQNNENMDKKGGDSEVVVDLSELPDTLEDKNSKQVPR
jgi:hypothetical protein